MLCWRRILRLLSMSSPAVVGLDSGMRPAMTVFKSAGAILKQFLSCIQVWDAGAFRSSFHENKSLLRCGKVRQSDHKHWDKISSTFVVLFAAGVRNETWHACHPDDHDTWQALWLSFTDPAAFSRGIFCTQCSNWTEHCGLQSLLDNCTTLSVRRTSESQALAGLQGPRPCCVTCWPNRRA